MLPSPAAHPPSMHLSILRWGQGWGRWGGSLAAQKCNAGGGVPPLEGVRGRINLTNGPRVGGHPTTPFHYLGGCPADPCGVSPGCVHLCSLQSLGGSGGSDAFTLKGPPGGTWGIPEVSSGDPGDPLGYSKAAVKRSLVTICQA